MTAVLMIFVLAGTPGALTFRVPVDTIAQCEALRFAPGTWWTLREGVTTRCEPEFET
jgi:hypothetical protein